MSGMGASSYRVETPEEIEARARRAAQERYEQAAVRHAAMVAEVRACRSAHGRRISSARAATALPADAPRQRIEAEEARLRAETVALRESLTRELESAFQAELTAFAAAPSAVRRETGADAPVALGRSAAEVAASRARRQEAETERRRAMAGRAAALLAAVPELTPEALRARCRQAAEKVVGAPGEGKAELALSVLEGLVRQAAAAHEEIRRTADRAAALTARLRSVPGPRAAELAAEIAALVEARAEELPAPLAAEAERLVAAADTERARRIAAHALARVLADLGYTVGEGFSTALVAEGTAYAGLPDENGYGLKVLFDRGSSTVRHIVVRHPDAESGPTADKRAQQSFCEVHPAVARGLDRYHVRLGEAALVPPGTRPVPTVAAGLIPVRGEGRSGGLESEA